MSERNIGCWTVREFEYGETEITEKLRDALALLMPYAVEIRYPDSWSMPNEADAREARQAVDQVLQWLQNALPQIFQNP